MKIFSALQICLLLCPLVLTQCSAGKPSNTIEIQTEYGNIEIVLYDQTPLHRDNFIKLVQEGYYDGTLFHRVIKDFMIQGGDPDSKNTKPGTTLGNGGPGYTIPAEFVPEYFHKRGALAAARQGNNINPQQASSGSQFYIVQGKVYTDEELNQIEMYIAYNNATQKLGDFVQEEVEKMRNAGQDVDQEEAKMIAEQRAVEYLQNNPHKIDEKIREVYKTIGGVPTLDGSYTVFGEVTKGLDVVDKIASVDTDAHDRPLKNIAVKIKFK